MKKVAVKSLQTIVKNRLVQRNEGLEKLLKLHESIRNSSSALNKVNYTVYDFEMDYGGLNMVPISKNKTPKLKLGDHILVDYNNNARNCPTPKEEGKIIHAYETNNGVYLVIEKANGKKIRRKNTPYRFWNV